MNSLWHGNNRGYLVDWFTQQWVLLTGKPVSLAEYPWLDGPTAPVTGIQNDFLSHIRDVHNIISLPGVSSDDVDAAQGLIADLNELASRHFDPKTIDKHVAAFYQRTARYKLDAWSEWSGVFRPFGALLRHLFSRRLQQLNVPLSPLDSRFGMTSQLIPLYDATSGERRGTLWLRHYPNSGDVIYAGIYSRCIAVSDNEPLVKVVFPLPHGNAIVLMRAIAHDDGSLTLSSEGDRFGDPGFYFVVHLPRDGMARTRYLHCLQETFRVYSAPNEAVVRADHLFRFFGLTFLKLHYRLEAH